jgi:hypothetical protein
LARHPIGDSDEESYQKVDKTVLDFSFNTFESSHRMKGRNNILGYKFPLHGKVKYSLYFGKNKKVG